MYWFTRLFVFIAPFYIIILWVFDDFDVYCCVVAIGYIILVFIWYYNFIFVMFPMLYGLWCIFCGLYVSHFHIKRNSDIEDIKNYFDEICAREYVQQQLYTFFGDDIGPLIDHYLGTEYLLDTATALKTKVQQYKSAKLRLHK
eukprot:196888_1